jgi:alpha-tubulin suppressor-like RCC1 family protein
VTIKTPKNISLINGGIKGISAACGNDHTLILDENKNVYAFGSNEDGVLGVENHELKSYSFIKVDFGKYNGRIKDISAGTVHNIALTDDGQIFSWGSAQGGQLGLSESYLISQNFKAFSTSIPTLIKIKQDTNLEEPMKIIKIACGEAHSIVLNSKKEVYSWGFGSNGQLGLGFCEDSFELGTGLSKSRIFTPKKIQALHNQKISDIQCGKTFSMFIDSNGGLYSCGVNDLYQLGIPDLPPQNHVKNFDVQCMDYIIPTRLEYFLDMKVEKISCGEAHCVAIVKDCHSNDKLIWSWGNNRSGQLGLGDKIKVSLPKPITFLFEYKKNKFESVSCGGFHSLCLIKHKEDINWIENDFKYNICKIINDIWNL